MWFGIKKILININPLMVALGRVLFVMLSILFGDAIYCRWMETPTWYQLGSLTPYIKKKVGYGASTKF